MPSKPVAACGVEAAAAQSFSDAWPWYHRCVRRASGVGAVDRPVRSGPVQFRQAVGRAVRGTLARQRRAGPGLVQSVLHGARISLRIGIISIGIGIAVGVPVGLISGYYGRWIDLLVQRLIDVMLAFPGILLAIVLVSAFGVGLENVMLAVGIVSIPTYARIVRGSVLALKEAEFVQAARAAVRGMPLSFSGNFAQLHRTCHRAVVTASRFGHFVGGRIGLFGTGGAAAAA